MTDDRAIPSQVASSRPKVIGDEKGTGEKPRPRAPVVIDRAGASADTPASVPPVPDLSGSHSGAVDGMPDGASEGAAMRNAFRLAARAPSRIARFGWTVVAALFSFVISVSAWDFVTGLLARNQLLGLIAMALIGLALLVVLILLVREWAGLARLRRLDGLRAAAEAALAAGDLGASRGVVRRLERLYTGRPEMRWGSDRLRERAEEIFDADGLLELAEAELMAPLDRAARIEVEAAARQVAAVTAIVPLALADVAAALTANLRMIRRIAEIYGGRAGGLGSWRLARAVMGHVVATGAVAVGDDLIGSVAGGGLLSKLSRRFGEGVVNGALTARVGVAAIEVCRPLPFRALPKPKITNLVSRALTGLFGRGGDAA